jgi:hypothetical protein
MIMSSALSMQFSSLSVSWKQRWVHKSTVPCRHEQRNHPQARASKQHGLYMGIVGREMTAGKKTLQTMIVKSC